MEGENRDRGKGGKGSGERERSEGVWDITHRSQDSHTGTPTTAHTAINNSIGDDGTIPCRKLHHLSLHLFLSKEE